MKHTTKSYCNLSPVSSPERVAKGAKSSPPLDTLALAGSNTTNRPNLLEKRARAKYLSRSLAASLARLESPLEKSYWNTWHCTSVIEQEGGKLTSRYCSNRWCLVCSRIRTARAINAYHPVIESWESPHFVTLTLRTVAVGELSGRIEAMLKAIAAIARSMRTTHRLPLKALRKLEVTSRPGGLYHPHFHLIVESREQAKLLYDLWLAWHPELVSRKGQDVRPCNGRSLVELAKYLTKVVAKTEEGKRIIPVVELDTIFQALKGRKTLRPMGFKLSKEVEESIDGEKIEVEASDAIKRVEETVYWEWIQEMTDWVDRETGECLAGYQPGERFAAFVEGIEEDLGVIESREESAITAEIQPAISATD